MKKLIILLAPLLLISSNDMPKNNNSATPPNILLIVVDDLGKEWISCYGSDEIAPLILINLQKPVQNSPTSMECHNALLQG